MRGIEGREAAEGADLGLRGVGRLLHRVKARALAGGLKIDDAARDRGLSSSQPGAIVRCPACSRGEALGGLGASPLAGCAVDAKRHAFAFCDQRPQRHRIALRGRVESGDLRRRVLAQPIEPQPLGGVALQQAREGGWPLLVAVQDADQEGPSLGLAGEPGSRLEDRRGCVVGVVEHQQVRPMTLAGLGEGRKGGIGDLPAARVEDRRSAVLDFGRQLGHEPGLADAGGAPHERADDPSFARLLPAPAQPAQLALAPGEQRRATLELRRQLHDRRRRVEARVLGQHRRLQPL